MTNKYMNFSFSLGFQIHIFNMHYGEGKGFEIKIKVLSSVLEFFHVLCIEPPNDHVYFTY